MRTPDAPFFQGCVVMDVGGGETATFDKQHFDSEKNHRCCYEDYGRYDCFHPICAVLSCKYRKGIRIFGHV